MSSDVRSILFASVAGALAGAAVVFYFSPQKSGKTFVVRTITHLECRSFFLLTFLTIHFFFSSSFL